MTFSRTKRDSREMSINNLIFPFFHHININNGRNYYNKKLAALSNNLGRSTKINSKLVKIKSLS